MIAARPLTKCHSIDMTITAKLPNETLCEIFQLLCDEPIALHILQNTSLFNKFPWAVGLVCKRWRAAFLSHPRLWTSLHLRDGTFNDNYIAEMNRRTAVYVERSRQLPLTVVIRACHTMRSNDVPQTQSTWRILLSLSHRWRTVELIVGTSSLADDLRECKGRMPILQSLKISLHFDLEVGLDAFDSAPCLAQVKLMRWQRVDVGILPLNQLKRFTIILEWNNLYRTRRLHSLLPALRNVEELRFLLFLSDAPIPEYPPVQLSHLRFLQISHPNMLSWIKAPSLEHLHVEDRSYYTRKDLYSEKLLYFVQHSSCHIRQLTLQCCDVLTAFSIMEILTHVNKLSIIDSSVDHSGAIIKAIANFDIYMPNLRVLEVTCYPGIATKMVVDAISPLLEMWNGKSGIIPLEKIVVQLKWSHYEGECLILDEVKEASWPSFVELEVVHFRSPSLRSVTFDISVARKHRVDAASPNAAEQARRCRLG